MCSSYNNSHPPMHHTVHALYIQTYVQTHSHTLHTQNLQFFFFWLKLVLQSVQFLICGIRVKHNLIRSQVLWMYPSITACVNVSVHLKCVVCGNLLVFAKVVSVDWSSCISDKHTERERVKRGRSTERKRV